MAFWRIWAAESPPAFSPRQKTFPTLQKGVLRPGGGRLTWGGRWTKGELNPNPFARIHQMFGMAQSKDCHMNALPPRTLRGTLASIKGQRCLCPSMETSRQGLVLGCSFGQTFCANPDLRTHHFSWFQKKHKCQCFETFANRHPPPLCALQLFACLVLFLPLLTQHCISCLALLSVCASSPPPCPTNT